MKRILFIVVALFVGSPMFAHAESKECKAAKKDLEDYKKNNAKKIAACEQALDAFVDTNCGEVITKKIQKLEDAVEKACK